MRGAAPPHPETIVFPDTPATTRAITDNTVTGIAGQSEGELAPDMPGAFEGMGDLRRLPVMGLSAERSVSSYEPTPSVGPPVPPLPKQVETALRNEIYVGHTANGCY